jgi:hypothetical protein
MFRHISAGTLAPFEYFAKGHMLFARCQALETPEGPKMKKLIAPALAATLALTATTAFAGGPVIIDDDTEVVPAKPTSSAGILPLLLIPIILCVALCGGDDEEPVED